MRAAEPRQGFLHADLEEGGQTLHQSLKQLQRSRPLGVFQDSPKDPLLVVLEMGERFYKWIDFINAARDPDKLLSLSSPERTGGYPIDAPIYNNERLVLGLYKDLKLQLPTFMSDILFRNAPFLKTLPLSDKDFIEFGLQVDKVYSRASRWLLQRPYLGDYAQRKKLDVRGYYFLQKIGDRNTFFANWSSLSEEDKILYRNFLSGLCFNADYTEESYCREELNTYENENKLLDYYNTYISAAASRWDSFFRIDTLRSDVNWNPTDASLMRVPFQRPKNPIVEQFLSKNIQEEWRLGDWQLQLDFDNGTRDSAYIVFKPGATPHVDRLGGNQITMDANRPLSEYDVQWTIRHEYGHVLGLPDCYVEFFDTRTEQMVSYQLDIENLMCSRKGHIQNTHYEELRHAYFEKTPL